MEYMAQPQVVTLLEPTWDRHIHLPANMGLLRVLIAAYPSATINFVGGQGQIDLIKETLASELQQRVSFVAWEPRPDNDTLPQNLLAAYRRLKNLPPSVLQDTSLIVLSSCTATVLTALTIMGLAKRSRAVLHGNANDLFGIRSRNPIRRHLDFRGSLQRFVKFGGRAVVLEDRIERVLKTKLPWIKNAIFTVAHTILPEECLSDARNLVLTQPIRIGFAGNASIDKGFRDFLTFAKTVTEANPGAFEFHAIGFLPQSSIHLDQSILITVATGNLLRSEYIQKLQNMHFIFLWHQENYYAYAPSGVVYDAINLGIPVISRNFAQIVELAENNWTIGYSFSDLSQAAEKMELMAHGMENETYILFLSSIQALRKNYCPEKIAETVAAKFLLTNS